MVRTDRSSLECGLDKLDDPTPTFTRPSKFRALLAKLTRRNISARKVATAKAAAEACRRLGLPATGPEAAEHKSAAEDARRYVDVHSARLRVAPTKSIRRRILYELAEAFEQGTTCERDWYALATEVPDLLPADIPRERDVQTNAELRATIWKKQRIGNWTFKKGERRSDRRRRRNGNDPLVSYGPREEVVVADYDPPIIDRDVTTSGAFGRAFGLLRGLTRGVRCCAWRWKNE